jgi:serine O-acetyltransferase
MTVQALDDFGRQVERARAEHGAPVQARRLAEHFTDATLALLFPHFAEPVSDRASSVNEELSRLCGDLHEFLVALGSAADEAKQLSSSFLLELPELQSALQDDAQATWEADPAANSVDEVLLAYPGFFAIACHRIAHQLCAMEVELLPRLITEYAHRETGVDIHPRAQIGRSLAIDHGTGIVVGETAVIGNRVRLYQGVTLGALSVRKDLASQKRHPTIEDDVVIYANATILGGEAVIGTGSVIGGNVWLTHAVPPGSIVTHEEAVQRSREAGESLLEYYI